MRAQSATEGHDSSGREEVMGHYTPPYDVPRDASGNKEPWKNIEKWAESNSVPEMKCPSLQPHALPASLSEVDGNLFSIRQTLVYESCAGTGWSA